MVSLWQYSDRILWDNPITYLGCPFLSQYANSFCLSVACVAGALGEIGVASRASLYLFKQEGYLINRITGETQSGEISQSGLLKVTNEILDVVYSEQIPPGRAVVSMSFGT